MEVESWAHIDIAGVMQSGGKLPFLSRKGGKEKNGEEEIACQQCVILIKAHTKCILLDGHFLVVET